MRNILLPLAIAFIFSGTWYASTTPRGSQYVTDTISFVSSGTFSSFGQGFGQNFDNRAAVFFTPSITTDDLQDKYAVAGENYRDDRGRRKEGGKINVLIVPGHEPNYGGTEFGRIRERELVVELSSYLAEFLKVNPKYNVTVTRDTEDWHPALTEYFKSSWDSIVKFAADQKMEMVRLVDSGKITDIDTGIVHNSVPKDVALRLYGINKWANENDMDIVIHVHFNDYPRRYASVPGKYSGFVIYVPESQYSNSGATREVAESVNKRLAKYYPTSDLPKEGNGQGIVEEQELIAIGSDNSVDAASMLIEYGYIYEPTLATDVTRKFTLQDMAFQTYLGLQDFFGNGNDVTLKFDTFALPYKFEHEIREGVSPSRDTLALQTALIIDGVYPPEGSVKNDCPRTGRVGPCTLKALAQFQKKYGVIGEAVAGKPYVGPKTLEVLNTLFSVNVI